MTDVNEIEVLLRRTRDNGYLFFYRFNFPAQMSDRPDHTPDRPDYITQLRALPMQVINVRFFEHIIEDHATPGPRFRQEMPLQNFGEF